MSNTLDLLLLQIRHPGVLVFTDNTWICLIIKETDHVRSSTIKYQGLKINMHFRYVIDNNLNVLKRIIA